ncbi:MAG: LutC/YkgG family protein [Myxococcota bacterium]
MSRRAILRALGRGEAGERSAPGASASPLPPPGGPWQRFEDPEAHFAAMLEAAGGTSRRAAGRSELESVLGERVQALGAHRVWIDPALGPVGTLRAAGAAFDERSLASTASVAALQLAVLAGEFGVAENGSVWVDGRGWPHPALHVLPEHLVLVVPDGELVPTMHEAYARLELGAPGFGTFLAGPSKTADIEQALVVGAHGPRSLAVVWLREG